MPPRIYWQGGGSIDLTDIPVYVPEEEQALPDPGPGGGMDLSDLPVVGATGTPVFQRPDLKAFKWEPYDFKLAEPIQKAIDATPDPGKARERLDAAISIHATLGVPFSAAYQQAEALQRSDKPENVNMFQRFTGGMKVADLSRRLNELSVLDMADYAAGRYEPHPNEEAQIRLLQAQAFDSTNPNEARILAEQITALQQSIMTPRQKEMARLSLELEAQTKKYGMKNDINFVFQVGKTLWDLGQASQQAIPMALGSGAIGAAATSPTGPGAAAGFAGGFSIGFGGGVTGYFARQATGQSWRDMTVAGGNKNVAFVLSIISGGLQAAAEGIGDMAVIGTIPGVDQALREAVGRTLQEIATGSVGKRLGQVLGTGVVAVAKETWEEETQNGIDYGAKVLADTLNKLIPGGPDPQIAPSWQEYVKEQALTAVVTPLLSALLVAPGTGLQLADTVRTQPTPTQQATQEARVKTEERKATVDSTLEAMRTAREEAELAGTPFDPTPHVAALQQHAVNIDAEIDQKIATIPTGKTIEPAALAEIMGLADTRDYIDQQTARIAPKPAEDPMTAGVRQTIRSNLPQFSEREVTAAGMVLDFRARREGATTEEYVGRTFAPEMFSEKEQAQGVLATQPGTNAAVSFLEDGKALLHAAERTDFKALVHEFAHVFRRQLTAEEQSAVDAAFGSGTQAEERFAEGFISFLQTGDTMHEDLVPVYGELSDLLSRFRSTFDEIIPDSAKSVFDNVLGGPLAESETRPGAAGTLFNPVALKPMEGTRTPGRLVDVQVGGITLSRDQLSKIDPRLPDVMESNIRGNTKEGLLAALKDMDLDLFAANETEKQRALSAITATVEATDIEGMAVRARGPGSLPTLFSTPENLESDMEWARSFGTPDEYIAAAKAMDMDPKTDDQYQQEWERAKDTPPSRERENAKFLGTIETKEGLQALLLEAWRALSEKEMTAEAVIPTAHALFRNAVDNATKGLSDANYNKLMEQIRYRPAEYRRLIYKLLDDKTMQEQLARETYTDPNAEALDKAKEAMTKLRGENANLKKTFGEMQKQIDAYKRALSRESDRASDAEARAKDWKTASKTSAKEALKNYRELLKARDYGTKLVKSIMSEPGNVPVSVKREIRAIQDGIATTGTRALGKLQEAIRTWQAAHPGEQLPPEAQKILNRRSAKNMTTPELEALREKAKDLRAAGRAEMERRRMARWQENITAWNNAIVATGNVDPKKALAKIIAGKTYKKGGTVAGQKVRGIESTPVEWLAAVSARPDTVGMFLDGGKKGENYKLLYETPRDLDDVETVNRTRRVDAFFAAMKEEGVAVKDMQQTFSIEGQLFNHNEALAVYLLRQNPDGERHLSATGTGKMNVTPDVADQMEAQLSPQEKAFGERIMEMFQGPDKERLRTFAEEVMNIPFEDVERYFPLVVENFIGGTPEAEIANDMLSRSPRRVAGVPAGMLQARTGSTAPIVLNAGATALSAIEKQEHLMAFKEHVSKLNFVYTQPSMVREIKRVGGEQLYNTVKRFIEDFANPKEVHRYDPIEQLSNAVRSKLVLSAITGNVTTIARNVPYIGAWISLPYTGRNPVEAVAYMLGGLGEWTASVADPNHTLWKFVTERDPQIRDRVLHPDLTAIHRIDWSKSRTAVDRALQLLNIPLEQGDRGTVLAVWKGAYNYMKARTGDERAAVAHAREAVERSQPQGKTRSLPVMLRTNMGKWLGLLGNQLNQMWNEEAYRMPMAMRDRDKAIAERVGFLVTLAIGYAISGVLMGIIERRRIPGMASGTMDTSRLVKEGAVDIVSQFIAPFPALGGPLLSLVAGKRIYDAASPLTSVTDTIKEVQGAVKGIARDYDLDNVAMEILGLIPSVLRAIGGPAAPVQRTLNAIRLQDLRELLGGVEE